MNSLLYRRKLVNDICKILSKIQIEMPSLYLNYIETPWKKGYDETISNTDYEDYLDSLQSLFKTNRSLASFAYRDLK